MGSRKTIERYCDQCCINLYVEAEIWKAVLTSARDNKTYVLDFCTETCRKQWGDDH